ncbi:sulfotransferase family protein [Winogradskyella sp. MIT101101]|uniref:sulfotransferase family protein n=1 Tax=Winogradskyella sp. MIT101101 TaxID=3098297 RepID=UPI00399AA209
MDKNDLPDFLIVGASKCGTTALSSHLSQTKGIFISTPKEPKYLTYSFLKNKYKGPGDDYTLKKSIKSLEDYKRLFSKAPINSIKGEASVDTLYYHDMVIPIIKNTIGNPKIIIMLREPASRAFSAYKHLVRDSREVESFQVGLEKEKERLQKGFEFIWAYKAEGLYYSSVKAYIENFKNVKIIIFEDFIKNQEKVVNDVLTFLGAEGSHKISSAIVNKSGKPKSVFLHNLLTKDYFIKDIFKRILSEKTKAKIKNFTFNKNLNKIPEDKETLENLRKDFSEDIDNLENLLSINLDVWKKLK